MDLYNYKSEIEKLIDEGIGIEEIAFQLECSSQDIKSILDSKSKIIDTGKDVKKPLKTETKKSRLDTMREKYKRCFNQLSIAAEELKVDPAFVNLVMEKIKSLYTDLQSADSLNKRGFAFTNIVQSLRKIRYYEVPMEDCKYLSDMLEDEKVKDISKWVYPNRSGYKLVTEANKIVDRKKGDSLLKKASETSDVEELDAITKSFRKISDMNFYLKMTLDKIEQRKSELKKGEIYKKIKYDISEETNVILRKMVNGTLTREEFDAYLEKEAEARKSKISSFGAPKGLDSYRKQVIISLKMILNDRGDIYKIEDIDNFRPFYFEYLNSSSQGETGYVNMVVSNLISSKDFKGAKEFCSRYTSGGWYTQERYPLYKSVREVEKRIAYAELGDTIANKLNNRVSYEDDEQFLDSLISRFKSSNGVNFSNIKLGKNIFESRDITLFDVWYSEEERMQLGIKKGVSK